MIDPGPAAAGGSSAGRPGETRLEPTSAPTRLSWYHSSAKARRGFCSRCGSSLFFDPLARDWIGVAMGAFDSPTSTRLGMHIFVSEKGDYYDIADGVPQNLR